MVAARVAVRVAVVADALAEVVAFLRQVGWLTAAEATPGDSGRTSQWL